MHFIQNDKRDSWSFLCGYERQENAQILALIIRNIIAQAKIFSMQAQITRQEAPAYKQRSYNYKPQGQHRWLASV